MRLTKSLAFAVTALALSTGAAFAGGDAMSPQDQREFLSSQQREAPLVDRSDPMGYQPYAYRPYEHGGPETLTDAELIGALEMLDVYAVPVEIVLIPLEPSEVPISADELG